MSSEKLSITVSRSVLADSCKSADYEVSKTRVFFFKKFRAMPTLQDGQHRHLSFTKFFAFQQPQSFFDDWTTRSIERLVRHLRFGAKHRNHGRDGSHAAQSRSASAGTSTRRAASAPGGGSSSAGGDGGDGGGDGDPDSDAPSAPSIKHSAPLPDRASPSLPAPSQRRPSQQRSSRKPSRRKRPKRNSHTTRRFAIWARWDIARRLIWFFGINFFLWYAILVFLVLHGDSALADTMLRLTIPSMMHDAFKALPHLR